MIKMVDLNAIIKMMNKNTTVTIIFIGVMVVYSIRYIYQLKKDISYESYIPEAVAALGILGTFLE